MVCPTFSPRGLRGRPPVPYVLVRERPRAPPSPGRPTTKAPAPRGPAADVGSYEPTAVHPHNGRCPTTAPTPARTIPPGTSSRATQPSRDEHVPLRRGDEQVSSRRGDERVPYRGHDEHVPSPAGRRRL